MKRSSVLDAKGVMEPYQKPRSYRQWLLPALVLISFTTLGVIIVLAWLEGIASSRGEPPLILAQAEPYRRAPNEHDDLPVVNDSLSIISTSNSQSEALYGEPVSSPELPGSPDLALAAEDSSSSSPAVLQDSQPQAVALAPEAAPIPPDEARTAPSEVPAAAPRPTAVPPVQTEAAPPARRYAIYFFSVRPSGRVASEWQRLAARYPDLAGLKLRAPRPVDIPGKERTFYAIEAGAFATQAEAQAVCDRLRLSGQSCKVVAP